MKRLSERTIGIVLVSGFVMLIVGAFVAPSGAYEGSIEDRLTIIEANEGQWFLSKIFDGLAVVFASSGLVMLSRNNSRNEDRPLSLIAGIAAGFGGIIGLLWIFALVTDPGPLYYRDTPALMAVLFITSMAISLVALGIQFLRSDYPRWASLLTTLVAAAVLVAIVLILILEGGPESAFGLASLMYLAILPVGIMLVRRSPSNESEHI
jgi:hypothetical protein